MYVCNLSNYPAIVQIGLNETIINTEERVYFSNHGRIVVTLKHDYSSSVMPEKEIRLDDVDVSAVSLLTAPYKEPYFQIVLDCIYEVTCFEDTILYIRQETINNIFLSKIQPKERVKYEKHYMNAITKNHKITGIVILLLITLCAFPILIIAFLAKPIAGFVLFMLLCGILVIGRIIIKLISNLICKAECAFVFADFDSNKIIRYFQEEKTKK